MKFSTNCEEKKGAFGGSFWELNVKVTLTEEEVKTARKYRVYKATLIGGDEAESALVYKLTRLSPISFIDSTPKTSFNIEDLSEGVKFKANNASELPLLLEFQEMVKQRCKNFKEYLEERQQITGALGQKGGISYEEEL